MAERRYIDWPAVETWADETESPASAIASHFNLPLGTVLAHFHHRKKAAPVVMSAAAAAVYVPLGQLQPWSGNPRKNEKTVAPLAKAIIELGWGAPVLARQDNGEIIAGHTRLKAALHIRSRWSEMTLGQREQARGSWSADAIALGEAEVPVVPVRYMDLNESMAHAMAVLDNRLAETSEWSDTLGEVLRDIPAEYIASGWSESEVAALLSPPPRPDAPAVKIELCPHCHGEIRR